MKRTLIIARHGNTFRIDQTPTRVGGRTDLPLVEEQRARGIGRYLKQEGMQPNRILAAPLMRTQQTAQLAAEELGANCAVEVDARFLEINYGPDENMPEDVVAIRLGYDALKASGELVGIPQREELQKLGELALEAWNKAAILPQGWEADIEQICQNWQELAQSVPAGETWLCVSSNGTMRFAPCITGDYEGFCAQHDIKVPTGGVCVFTSENGGAWRCEQWGVKAFKKLQSS